MAGTDQIQPRTITHTGQELGSDMVELKQNQTSPQRKSRIVAFECPSKFESIRYVGQRHWTKLELRTLEEISADGSGEYTLSTRLQAIAGEQDLDDQPFEVVKGVNVTTGDVLDVESVDYASDTVTLANTHTSGDTLKFYPVITEGTVQYRGVNQLDQLEGPVDRWDMPVYRFADFDQDKRGTEINLRGSARWSRYEKLELVLDAPDPYKVIWEDADYPDGQYVSTIEQRVDVEL